MLREKVICFIRFLFKEWDRFAFLLSLYGATAFAMSTLIPTLLDPLLLNPLYGTRTYPLGPWVSVVSGIVFIFLYRSNVMEKDFLRIGNGYLALNRGCFSFLSILIPVIIVLPNFLPEFPHMWVSTHSIVYATVVAFASFLRNYCPDYSFVEDNEIEPRARIELVRIIYNSYYIGLALLATIGAGAIGLASSASQTYTDINEQIILDMAGRIDMFYTLFGLFCGMAYQTFAGMCKAQQKLRKIKKIKAS